MVGDTKKFSAKITLKQCNFDTKIVLQVGDSLTIIGDIKFTFIHIYTFSSAPTYKIYFIDPCMFI